MFYHIELTRGELRSLIHKGVIKLGGNKSLKIYGTLSCRSGKRMKKENRVFFRSEGEAIDEGYRPCGHCMKDKSSIERGRHNDKMSATKAPLGDGVNP